MPRHARLDAPWVLHHVMYTRNWGSRAIRVTENSRWSMPVWILISLHNEVEDLYLKFLIFESVFTSLRWRCLIPPQPIAD